ncbi:MAG: phospholipase D-like domain-containing protein [Spirochaetaceae bacterium]|jgi:cardiolipin synthase|nr:phospholipase D-like domain-containing protein [Spirochaetaceae bacterium]
MERRSTAIQYDKNWKRIILRRRVLVITAVAIQLFFILAAAIGLHTLFRYVYWTLYAAGLVFGVRIINRHEKPPAYKITWIFLMLISPIAGGLLYLALYFQTNQRKYRAIIKEVLPKRVEAAFLPGDTLPELRDQPSNEPGYLQARFLQTYAQFPLYKHTRCEYLPSGEAFWERAFEEMAKAEKYIFLEFFIVNPGYLLDQLLIVLEKKVKKGVDVRLIYDDIGCFMSLPNDFPAQLRQKGIRCFVFNRLSPALSSIQNNRDHRKIISIDGKTAFTGGVNIGDEYINAYEKYGHWKDAGIMLNGEGAWGLTLIFLHMWNFESERKKTRHDRYAAFYPWTTEPCLVPSDGFVLPYSENPIDGNNVGSQVYLQIINTARKYVYINTPYLILDDSIRLALTLSAKTGVDVRIITPHRPDKRAVHLITRSYYCNLIEAGVRIFEYTRGFNHSKTFVADDAVATVGTMNLDFRSLYLHFECGVWLYRAAAIRQIQDDFLATQAQCEEITPASCESSFLTRAVQDTLRIIAPLM